MHGVELVIFDCDGILVDSERLSVDISVQVLNDFGLYLTRAQVIERFVGATDGLIEATIERQTGRQLTEAEHAGMRSRYRDAYEQRLKPVRGVTEMLPAIRHPMCVASGSRPDVLRRKLEICGLLPYFDGRLFSASQVAAGKPAPDVFLLAAAAMGASPKRCVAVEDSVYGVAAARAAGMRALAYGGGLIAAEALAGPDTVIFEEMDQLPSLIGEMT
ncbi:MAG TPA: HAD-IA family hydrolase [Solirubrobacteraceae bacterium]|jgi:HAD superfamily hydrolase (TIGR01509 family)|nr:HAD-IA family hydrolase [Solirubrobacteraceae bacterium]